MTNVRVHSPTDLHAAVALLCRGLGTIPDADADSERLTPAARVEFARARLEQTRDLQTSTILRSFNQARPTVRADVARAQRAANELLSVLARTGRSLRGQTNDRGGDLGNLREMLIALADATDAKSHSEQSASKAGAAQRLSHLIDRKASPADLGAFLAGFVQLAPLTVDEKSSGQDSLAPTLRNVAQPIHLSMESDLKLASVEQPFEAVTYALAAGARRVAWLADRRQRP